MLCIEFDTGDAEGRNYRRNDKRCPDEDTPTHDDVGEHMPEAGHEHLRGANTYVDPTLLGAADDTCRCEPTVATYSGQPTVEASTLFHDSLEHAAIRAELRTFLAKELPAGDWM